MSTFQAFCLLVRIRDLDLELSLLARAMSVSRVGSFSYRQYHHRYCIIEDERRRLAGF